MDIFDQLVDEIKSKHPKYKEFINNYFLKNKKQFFMIKHIIIV